MNYSKPELRDKLASEYVLGTLQGRARRRFKRLLDNDAAMRAAVEFWERELVPMASPLRAPAPSAALWNRIAARVAPSSAAPAPTWFERWFGARTLGSLAAGLFLGLSLSLVLPPLVDRGSDEAGERQLPASYVGILNDTNGRPAMLVSSRRHGRVADIKVLRPIGLGQDQVLLLWALPSGGAPIPLGRVPSSGKARLDMAATSEELLANVSELAVSVAARDAPPAAAPSGAFILRGACAKFW